MMNLNSYIHPPRPDKADFTTYFVYHRGEVMFKGHHDQFQAWKAAGNGRTDDGNMLVEKVLDEDAYKAVRTEHVAACQLLDRQLKTDMLAEVGLGDHPRAENAWELVKKLSGEHGLDLDEELDLLHDLARLILE